MELVGTGNVRLTTRSNGLQNAGVHRRRCVGVSRANHRKRVYEGREPARERGLADAYHEAGVHEEALRNYQKALELLVVDKSRSNDFRKDLLDNILIKIATLKYTPPSS